MPVTCFLSCAIYYLFEDNRLNVSAVFCCVGAAIFGLDSLEDIPVVGSMHLVFTRIPGESYRGRFRSLLLCCPDVFMQASRVENVKNKKQNKAKQNINNSSKGDVKTVHRSRRLRRTCKKSDTVAQEDVLRVDGMWNLV